MGGIESSLGRTQFESGPSGGRTFTVDDPTLHLNDAPQRITVEELQAIRNKVSSESQRVDNGTKRRIEILLGIGRAFLDVKIDSPGGFAVYTLRTLKSKEKKHVMGLAEELERFRAEKQKLMEKGYDLRNQTLAYSICSIDGIDIDTILDISGRSQEERDAIKLAFSGELDDSVAEHLYSKFQELSVSNRIEFKTANQAKEVAEQIKKSGEGT